MASVYILPFVKTTFIVNVYFAYFLAGFNSTLNANTMYSIYTESVVLEANSYFSWLYTVYNFMLSVARQMVADPLDYKAFIRMFLVFKVVGVCVLVWKGKKRGVVEVKQKVKVKGE